VEQPFLADGDATFLITARNRIDAAEKAGMLKNGTIQDVGDTAGGFAAPPGGRRYFLTNGGGLG